MGKHEKYEHETVIEAILKNDGNLNAAAATLGCTRQTLHGYVQRHEEIARVTQGAREPFPPGLYWYGRKALITAIDRGEQWAIEKALEMFKAER